MWVVHTKTWVRVVVALYGLHFLLSFVSFTETVGMPCPGLRIAYRAKRVIAVPGTAESLDVFRQQKPAGPLFVEAINRQPVCRGVKPDCDYELARNLLSVRSGDINVFELRQNAQAETFTVSIEAGPTALAALLHAEWAELVLQAVGLLYLVVGLTVFFLRPEDRAAVPLVLFSALFGLAANAVTPHNLWSHLVESVESLAIPLLFPTIFYLGHSFSARGNTARTARFRWLLGLSLLAAVVDFTARIADIFAVEGAALVGTVSGAAIGFVGSAALLLTLDAVIREARSKITPGSKRRARVFALAVGVAFLFPAIALTSRPFGFDHRLYFSAELLYILSLGSFPVILGYSIVRYQMFDLRVVLRQGLVYGTLSIVLSLSYLLVAFAAYRILGQSSRSTALVALGVGVTVVGLSLAKVRVQRWVDKVVFRSREIYASAIGEASSSLARANTEESISSTLKDPLIDKMELSGAYLGVIDPHKPNEVRRHPLKPLPTPLPAVLVYRDYDPLHRSIRDQAPAAAHDSRALKALGEDSADEPGDYGRESKFWGHFGIEIVLPLVVATEEGHLAVRGLLILGPKHNGRPFDPEDMELVTTLSNQVAVALENAAAFEEIKRQQSALVKLVAGIVHEVNTPLGALRSSVDTIARSMEKTKAALVGKGDPSERQNRALEAISAGRALTENAATASRRISTLVGSLKEYVNLEEEQRQVVDIRECVERSAKEARENLEEGVVLNCSLPAVQVFADCFPSRLCRAITNILDNAIAAIDESGAVDVTLQLTDGYAEIVIKDDGRGISPDELDRITDFGFTTKRGQTRTGLRMGLPYARRVADEVGGHLSIQSDVGSGTTVTLTLRRAHHR